MTGPLRRGGSGRQPDGTLVTWSVAEGRRGRRWREVRVAPDGAILASLLLEVDPDGRFSHAELSTAAGLLTLHPEGDGTLHGNTINERGIEHVRGLPWLPDAVLLVDGSAVAEAAAAGVLRRHEPTAAPAVLVTADLGLNRLEVDAEPILSRVDDRGLPRLDRASDWALEGD